MKKILFAALVLIFAFSVSPSLAQQPRFRALAFYSTKVEPDHVLFSDAALKFFSGLAAKNNFTFDSTTNWDDLNEANISKYQVVMWLNDEPSKPEQKKAFQNYMEHGGAWLGFHVSAYNDKDSNWPWFVTFLGGSVFESNEWPPLPAKLTVDDRGHPVTANIPQSFVAPANEWYTWKPSPRLNPDVRVLVSFDPSNYPIGFKDILKSGDMPVVWTNTKYKMLYMNMGHGDKILTTETQNQLIANGLLWLGTGHSASPSEVSGTTGTLINPHGVVVNQKTDKVYAVETAQGAVTILDAIKGSSTAVKVGEAPVAIAINPVTNKIYVANSGGDTISVIDGSTDSVSANIKVGPRPYTIAVNSATNKIYVTRTFGDTMTVINGETNETSKIKPPIQADVMEVNAGTNKMYLTHYESKNITVMNGTTHETTPVATGVHIWAAAINPTTNKIYFPSAGSSSLFILDGQSNYVSSVITGDVPCAVAIDTVANRIYTANFASNNITVVDGATENILATIPVGTHPQGIAVNSSTHTVYVANTGSNNVSVINGANNKVVATVDAGVGPFAIAIDTNSGKAFVATMGKNNLVVIDAQSTLKKFFPLHKKKNNEAQQ